MEIKSKREGEVLTVWLEGDVCPGCVPQTEAFFNGNVDGVKKLVVDFGGVKKLAKEGLMLLLSTKKKLAGAECRSSTSAKSSTTSSTSRESPRL